MLAYAKRSAGCADSEKEQALLDKTSKRLLSALPDAATDYDFWVNPRGSFNAASYIGRNITVNQGTFALLKSNEDLLAFVVGHEIAHSHKHHVLSRYDKTITLELFRQAWAASGNRTIGQWVVADIISINYLRRGLSQSAEWEADNVGFDMAVRAGYNPGAAVVTWMRVKNRYGSAPRGFFGDLLAPSTHPDANARIANFKQRIIDMGQGKLEIVDKKLLWCGSQVELDSFSNQEEENLWMTAGRLVTKQGG